MKIKLNEVYEYKGMEVEVLKEDTNSSGDTVYACMKVDDPKHLLWIGKNNLQESLRELIPLQKDYVNSNKKQFNIIACGRGAGATTALFENIIKEKVHCYVVTDSKVHTDNFINQLFLYVNSRKDFTVTKNLESHGISLEIENLSIKFKVKVFDAYPSRYERFGHVYDVRNNEEKRYSPKNYIDHLKEVGVERVTFVTKPSDLVSGYSTTTEEGYYEVKTCNSFILKLIIHKTGKVPKDEPNCIKKFLDSHTNLITGYNYKDNKFLPEKYGLSIESLDETDRVKCLGNWVKV